VIDSTPISSFSSRPPITGRSTNTPIEPVIVAGDATIASAPAAT
jgi:hypothetical protein